MTPEIEVGDKVKKVTGDYEYEGIVVSKFKKVNGLVRLVVEEERGMLHIYNENQMEIVTKQAHKA